MNLVIDRGNTRVKLALFEQGRLLRSEAFEPTDDGALERLLTDCPGIRRALVASSGGSVERTLALLRSRVGETLHFESGVPVPVGIAYRTPQTLGCDRLAGAVGATVLFPGSNVLVVDAGTALTMDLVDAVAVFRGGVISPGMRMRFRALHEFTARLPLCSPTEDPPVLGRDTDEAIVAGVMNGMAQEMDAMIDRVRARWGTLKVIFTGGDAKFFVNRIKNTIFADPDLVLRGLNRILEHNAIEKNMD